MTTSATASGAAASGTSATGASGAGAAGASAGAGAGAAGAAATGATAGLDVSQVAAGASGDAKAGAAGADPKAGAAAAGSEKKPDAGAAAKLEVKWAEGAPLSPDFQGKFVDAATKLGLEGPKAQGLADFFTEQVKAQRAAEDAAARQELQTWQKTLAADPEWGGANLESTKKFMESGARQFATPGLLKVLRESGFGAHPEVVAHFARLGKLNKEDSMAGASSGAPTKLTGDAALKAAFGY